MGRDSYATVEPQWFMACRGWTCIPAVGWSAQNDTEQRVFIVTDRDESILLYHGTSPGRRIISALFPLGIVIFDDPIAARL